MLRVLVLLASFALAAAAVNNFPQDHLLGLEAAVLANFAAPPTNQTFYFPCDGLEGLKYKKNLQPERDLGQWYSTNVAFPVSHHYNQNDIQKLLVRNVGCSKTFVNASSTAGPNNIVSQMDMVYRSPIDPKMPIPDGAVVVNGNTIRFSRKGYPARAGDLGWWILEFTNSTTGNTFKVDGYIVDTDYTNFKISFTCSDVPVPFSADTARVQQWVLSRRQPWNFNAVQVAAFKVDAKLHGIHDNNNLFQLATDQC